ncbi:hypothetical protein Gasu2_02940 [Galdieria sulphuraria]|uniref:MARVEL domain-containing protein n=1 Tax=Galdieria sulphuraria TaxID=130081 RepID=M2Y0F4_GALSU|nr:uncharacterized protein Gasu_32020 [Galdieria sulphuraria]EME29373.1 hypothetical protein Gasu_32020 [Galdieria sulphuraria]GJD05845.1 hypothetical protein Gasu2_02940 [Galdieria sulphuraria]|eukprot:XP_005705893.1 hypothetical protein Gasu_32020 [Galdieria sulphuraria]
MSFIFRGIRGLANPRCGQPVDLPTGIMYSLKQMSYIVQFAFSVVVIAMFSQVRFYLYRHFKCSFGGHWDYATNSEVSGPAGYCRYFIALGSISIVLLALIAAATFGTLYFEVPMDYVFYGEWGVNAFLFIWWVIGAAIITARRPSDELMQQQNNLREVVVSIGFAWTIFFLTMSNIVFSVGIYFQRKAVLLEREEAEKEARKRKK